MSIENINHAELCAETTDIIELADEQLEAVAGGAEFQPSRVEEPATFFGIPIPGVSKPLRQEYEDPNIPKMPQAVSSAADASGAILDGADGASKFGQTGRALMRMFPRIF